MKNWIVVVAFMMITGVVFSQKGEANNRLEKLTEELSLTNKQVKKIKALYKKKGKAAKKDRAEISAMTEAERAEFKAEREAMRAERDADMKEILTAEQYEKYVTMQKPKRGKAKMKGEGMGKARMNARQGADARLEKMAEELSLNASQKKEIAQIFLANKEARVERGAKLTEEEKMARKEARLASRQMMDEKISAILTPEQLVKYEAMKKQRMSKGAKLERN